MVETNGTSPVYIGGNDGMGFGGGGFIWAFLIFALLFGGFGNRGGNDALAMAALANNRSYDPQYATSNEVQRGFDNQNTIANQREILSAVNTQGQAGIAATNQTFHDSLMANQNLYNELTRDIGALSVTQQQTLANQNQCCCETRMQISETRNGILAGIAQNRYEAAMNTAAINANTTAQTQKILDAIAQNKIETLQNRVNQLEMRDALGNVVRYPTTMSYNAGTSPFCNCGNGGYPYYA